MALLSVIETSNHYWAIGITALPHLTLWPLIEHPDLQGSTTGYTCTFIQRNVEEGNIYIYIYIYKNTAPTGAQRVSHLTSLADFQGESGSLIDWCWFHLGSEQRLTVDLSRRERQPLILVPFKQRVLIYVIFTKPAREERLPFYVWLFIEVRECVRGLGEAGRGVASFVQHQHAANAPLALWWRGAGEMRSHGSNYGVTDRQGKHLNVRCTFVAS